MADKQPTKLRTWAIILGVLVVLMNVPRILGVTPPPTPSPSSPGGSPAAPQSVEQQLTFLTAAIAAVSDELRKPLGNPAVADIHTRMLHLYGLDTSIRDVQQAVSKPEDRKLYGARIAKARADVIALHRTAFPKLRRSFAQAMYNVVWENDITVAPAGDGSSILELTGAGFASHGNIKTIEDSLGKDIDLLRFKDTRYYWYKGSEWIDYKHPTPADGDIVVIEGDQLNVVPPLK